jgi:UDP-glucose 6-dehydrogenase
MKRYQLYVNDELKMTTDNRKNIIELARKIAASGAQVQVFDYLAVNRNEAIFETLVPIPPVAPLGWTSIDTSHD